jgi:hypothetical protein
VARYPMAAMTRLVLRAVLLHANAKLTVPCRASACRLAAMTSLSPRHVDALLRDAEQSAFVRRSGTTTEVTLCRNHDTRGLQAEVRRLWASAAKLTDRWVKSDSMKLTAADDGRLRPPALVDDSTESDDSEDRGLDDNEAAYLATFDDGLAARFAWIRDVVEHGS